MCLIGARRGTHCLRSRRRPCTCRRPRAAMGRGIRGGFVRRDDGEGGRREGGSRPGRPANRRVGSFGCLGRPEPTNSESRKKLNKRVNRGRGTHVGAGGLGLVLGVAAVVRHYRCFSLAAVLSARGDTNARLELPRPVALEKQTTSIGGEKKGIHLKSPPQLGSRALCDLAGWDFC
jgi:hypothetical protein